MGSPREIMSHVEDPAGTPDQADADFIAVAREDVPWLLDQLEKARRSAEIMESSLRADIERNHQAYRIELDKARKHPSCRLCGMTRDVDLLCASCRSIRPPPP
jgi:hypothetical protein